MPASHPTPTTADLRAAIDPDQPYVVQVNHGSAWTRPSAEHAVLLGLDVLHAVRRARHGWGTEVRTAEHGIITLASDDTAMRFIPQPSYEAFFCAADGCEASTEDGQGRDGLCGDCADQTPAAGEAPPAVAAPSPYTPGDLRAAAITVHQMLLDSLDATSGVAEGIADHTIPSTAGTAAERTWQSLGDQASTAYRAVYQLLDKAPDLSRWAIDMAADRLAPEPEPLIRWQDDAPAAAVHLAFAPHVTPEERAALRQALLLALRIAL